MNRRYSGILPVIDLQAGVAVRGVGGRRELYRPVESRLTESPDPGDVARALRRRYGFRDIYVADLDAISGAGPDSDSYEAIQDAGLSMWLDAGVYDRHRAHVLLSGVPEEGCPRMVIGLESLRERRELPPLVDRVGPNRVVFSLDLLGGKPLTRIADWKDGQPLDIVGEAARAGIGTVIVLDLAAVGGRAGPSTAGLCRALRQAHERMEIVSGGGIRNLHDMQSLLQAGCDRVMVASALHDGSFENDDPSEMSPSF